MLYDAPPPPQGLGRVLSRPPAVSAPAPPPVTPSIFVQETRKPAAKAVPDETAEVEKLRARVAALELELAHLRFQAAVKPPEVPAVKPQIHRLADATGQVYEHQDKAQLEEFIRQRNAALAAPRYPVYPQYQQYRPTFQPR